ncbi:MAG: isoprenylcysteine carboxylmethyltransferase family protein [Devosia sp.]|nr:isoprenylcysteine carboxylmethyltransferase family protein [Devosia sp.]
MELLFNLVIFVVSLVVVGQHVWATRGHFVSDGMARGAMLLATLVIVSTLVFSLLLFIESQPPWAELAGLVLELASLALFWAAIRASRQARLRFAFDPGLPHGIIEGGPYRYLRHPFYVSYLLFWFGWGIAIWSVWTLPFLIAFVAFYANAARGEERKFAATAFAPDYERYKRTAGFFWPKLGGFGSRQ